MNYVELLSAVTDLVIKAGALLAAEWVRPNGPRGRGDKADVDSEIEVALRHGLLGLLDCDFWGEETGVLLKGHVYCWVVDPNDGTTDFLLGHKGSAISVGLLYNSRPVLGVVYAPVTSDCGPDCLSWAEGCGGVIRNGRPVETRLDHLKLECGAQVLVSAAATKKLDINIELSAPAGVLPMPSIAYRLARVAAGDAVAACSLVPVSAHDVVGGHALLIGAGGVLLNQQGAPVTYDSKDQMATVSLRCFGGAADASRELVYRDWDRLF